MKKSKYLIGLMGVLLGLSLIFAGQSVRAAEKTEIHINAMFDLTGSLFRGSPAFCTKLQRHV